MLKGLRNERNGLCGGERLRLGLKRRPEWGRALRLLRRACEPERLRYLIADA